MFYIFILKSLRLTHYADSFVLSLTRNKRKLSADDDFISEIIS